MNPEVYNIKRVRGCILAGLQALYPNAVSGGVIYREIVQPAFSIIDWREFLQELDYLQERGFVEPISDGLGRAQTAKARMFRVTASGVDVGCGVASDPAIDVEV